MIFPFRDIEVYRENHRRVQVSRPASALRQDLNAGP